MREIFPMTAGSNRAKYYRSLTRPTEDGTRSIFNVFARPHPPRGQRHAASLPRVSGPLQEQRPNMDVGARRHTTGLDRPQKETSRRVDRSQRHRHARVSIPLTVLAFQTPFCFVGTSFWLRLPAISRRDIPPARYCRIIRIVVCSTPFSTSWWFR